MAPENLSMAFGAVAQALVSSMDQERIPGAALGVWSGGHEEHATFGVASVNTEAPVGPDTLFQVGSLTKTYTATAVWRLIERGDVVLDAPVRRYLPGLRLADEATAKQVTIKHLLTHSGGWYGDDGTYTGEDDDALARFVSQRLPQLPQLCPVGRSFSYNNAGFIVLGRVIEALTDAPYRAAMNDLVFAPLGVTDTLLDRSVILGKRYADGHYFGPVNGTDALAVQTPMWLPRSIDPAGGVWSTTRDVLRYARMHLGEPTPGQAPLLSGQALQQMQLPAIGVPGLNLSMGHGWFVQWLDGLLVISHNGDTGGQHTTFVAVPQKRFALVMLCNNGVGGARVELAVLDAAMRAYPGMAPLAGSIGMVNAMLAPADASPPSLPPPVLTHYAGRYADPGTELEVALTATGLTATVRPIAQTGTYQPALRPPVPLTATPLTFLGPDRGVLGAVRLPFVRDDAGVVTWVSSGLRLLAREAPTAGVASPTTSASASARTCEQPGR